MNNRKYFLEIVRFYFLILFLSFYFPCLSQTKADSIQKIWSDTKRSSKERFAAYESYYLLLIQSNPKSILESSISHLQLAKKEASKKETLLALSNKSNSFNLLGKNKESLYTLEIAYQFAKMHGDSVSMANNLGNRGVICYSEGSYKEAVSYYMKSLAVFRKMKLYSKEALLLNNLGDLFNSIEDHKQALYYLEKSQSILKQLGTENESEYIWLSLSETAINIKEYTKGLKYNKNAFLILKRNNNKIGLSTCYFLFSKIEKAKGNKKNAIQQIKKSLSLSIETEVESQIILYKLQLAKLYLQDNINEATEIGEEVLTLVNDKTNNEVLVELYDLLYKCYKKQNKINLSLEMLEKYNFYNERFIKQKKDFDIIRQVIQKEFADELRETKVKNTASIEELEKKQRKKVIIILLISIMLFLGSIFVYRKRLISNRKERDLLLNEIEFIKSNKSQPDVPIKPNEFNLNREKIEISINKKLNETDWNVLNILYLDPVISNQGIADKAFMSLDGIGSSLRRMYDLFEIKESKYKKISLLHEVVRISNNS